MRLENETIKIDIDQHAQVTSIKFNEKEMLYQFNKEQIKRFPIIFPSLGKSKGFEYDGKKYEMPNNGWWQKLEWQSFYENGELLSVATLLNQKQFPFLMDLVQRIGIDNNTLYINYEITNLDKKDTYFQFGIHPAFKIDTESFIKTDIAFKEIDLKGALTNNEVMPNGIPIKAIPFEKEFDTLIGIDSGARKISLVNKEETITFGFDSKHIQLWKSKKDDFICINPWYSWNDAFYDAPVKIEEKQDIIKLDSHRTWVASFEIDFKNNKKK